MKWEIDTQCEIYALQISYFFLPMQTPNFNIFKKF